MNSNQLNNIFSNRKQFRCKKALAGSGLKESEIARMKSSKYVSFKIITWVSID